MQQIEELPEFNNKKQFLVFRSIRNTNLNRQQQKICQWKLQDSNPNTQYVNTQDFKYIQNMNFCFEQNNNLLQPNGTKDENVFILNSYLNYLKLQINYKRIYYDEQLQNSNIYNAKLTTLREVTKQIKEIIDDRITDTNEQQNQLKSELEQQDADLEVVITKWKQKQLVYGDDDKFILQFIKKLGFIESDQISTFTWDQLNIINLMLQNEVYIDKLTKQEQEQEQEQESPHFVEQYANMNKKLYIINSPTGTGKTLTFMIGNLLAKYLQPNTQGLNSIVFSNSYNVQIQTFDTYKKSSNLIISSAEIFCNNNEVSLFIQTYNSNKDLCKYVYITTKSFEQDDQVIFKIIQNPNTNQQNSTLIVQNAKFQTKTVYLNQKKYIITESITGKNQDGTPVIVDMNAFRLCKTLGDVLFVQPHHVQFLNLFGIFSPFMNVQNLIYDEVDQFYNLSRIDEFHKYYFNQLYNNQAQNIFFVSATLDNKFIQIHDPELDIDKSLLQQVYLSRKLNIMQQTQFTLITQNGNYQVQSLLDFESIMKDAWEFGNIYLYYDLYRGFKNYIKILNDKLIDKNESYYKSVNGNSNMNKYMFKLFSRFKVMFITNRQMRNQRFQYIDNLNSFRSIFTSSLLQKVKPFIRFKYTHIDENTKQTQDTYTLQTITELYTQYAINAVANKQKTLFVTIKDIFMANRLTKQQIKQFNKQQSSNDIAYAIQHLQKIDIKNHKINFGSPFAQDFNVQTGQTSKFVEDAIEQEEYLIQGDFRVIGRGVDIPNLKHILILIPLHINLQQLDFGLSTLKQIVGRVGRFKNTGYAEVAMFSISDLAQSDAHYTEQLSILNIKQESFLNYVSHGIEKNVGKWEEFSDPEMQRQIKDIEDKNKQAINKICGEIQDFYSFSTKTINDFNNK